MENATKALLIAGSILIVIVLIALGIRIFNSSANTQDLIEPSMSETEKASFNNKFLPYCGKNKSGAIVRNLLDKVVINNNNNLYKVGFHLKDGLIDINRNMAEDISWEAQEITKELYDERTYIISAVIDVNGRVVKIKVTRQS